MLGHNALPALAAGIKAAHANAKASALQAAEQALEAGRLLNEARKIIPHGVWAEWLQQHVGFSERSARRYMQIARAGFNSATVAKMGLRRVAEALGEGSGPLPRPVCELEVFASAAMDFGEPFAAIREVSSGGFGLVYLADGGLVSLQKPFAFDYVERILAVASEGRLSGATRRWRQSDNGMFAFLSEVAEVERTSGKSAAIDRGKHLAHVEVDKAEAALRPQSESTS